MEYDLTIPALSDMIAQPIRIQLTPVELPPPPTPWLPMRGVRGQANACNTALQAQETVDALIRANANAYFYPVHYDGKLYADLTQLDRYSDFDQLGHVIERCHAADIQVYALFACAPLGEALPGFNVQQRVSTDKPWLDFASVDARAFLAQFLAGVMTYDIDGVLLDYARWKSGWPGNLGLLPADVTQAVRQMREAVKAVRDVPFGSYVFRTRETAGWAGQDWEFWIDAGLVDFVTPGAYYHDRDEESMAGYVADWKETLAHWPKRIIPRLSARWFQPQRVKTLDDLLGEFSFMREQGAAGFTLWDDLRLRGDAPLMAALADGAW